MEHCHKVVRSYWPPCKKCFARKNVKFFVRIKVDFHIKFDIMYVCGISALFCAIRRIRVKEIKMPPAPILRAEGEVILQTSQTKKGKRVCKV